MQKSEKYNRQCEIVCYNGDIITGKLLEFVYGAEEENQSGRAVYAMIELEDGTVNQVGIGFGEKLKFTDVDKDKYWCFNKWMNNA